MRVNYQAVVWNNNKEPDPQLPLPQNFGWELDDKEWLPVMATLPPAPKAVIQLMKCALVCAKHKMFDQPIPMS